MVKKILECFAKENYKKNQTEFRVEQAIQVKGDKLYVKLKGYGNAFNSQIDKNDIVI